MKFLLVQKTEVDPVAGLGGEPHVGETLYSDLAEVVMDLGSGQDNYWTHQVLALEFEGDMITGMQDLTQNVCNLLEAASWLNAQMGLPVHPMALKADSGSLAEYIENRNICEDVKDTGRKLDTAFAGRCVEMGIAI